MASVLPGSPPGFDKNDIAGTVKGLCVYTRNLQENLDFQLLQLTKEISELRKILAVLQSQ